MADVRETLDLESSPELPETQVESDERAQAAAEAARAMAALEALEEAMGGAEEPAAAPADETALGDTEDSGASPGAPEPPRKRRRLRTWHVVVMIIILLMAAIMALTSLFVWDRWYRYDDEADIEGTWYVLGTSVPIEISDGTIRFTENTAYAYSIDPSTKTIRYELGNLDGEGHYWFEEDRSMLVITDGEGFTRDGTAAEDLMRLFQRFSDLSSGKVTALPAGQGVIILSRTPDSHGPSVMPERAQSSTDEPSDGSDSSEHGGEDPQGGEAFDASPSQSPRDVFDVVGDIVSDR